MFTLREAGYRLKKSPSTLRRHIKAGNITAVHMGRSWLISEQELARIERQGLPILPSAIRWFPG